MDDSRILIEKSSEKSAAICFCRQEKFNDFMTNDDFSKIPVEITDDNKILPEFRLELQNYSQDFY